MKKFLKFCLIAAVILILAGLILGVVSMTAGGGRDVARMVQNGELTYNNEDFGFSLFESESDFGDILNFDFAEAEPIYELDDVEVFDGGKEILTGNIPRMELAAENITDLEITLGGGEFLVKNSDDGKFYLEAENAEKLQVYADDETLHLKAIRTKANDLSMNVTLYIPEGISYDEMSLELGAGVLEIEDAVSVDNLEGEVGVGQMVLHNLTCNSLDVNVGAGEFFGKTLVVNKEAELKVGAGHIRVDSVLCENLDVECAVGSAEITVAEHENSYNYEIDCAAGMIQVGDSEFSGLSAERTIDNKASKEMNLECAMGSIEIDFER